MAEVVATANDAASWLLPTSLDAFRFTKLTQALKDWFATCQNTTAGVDLA